MKHFSICLNAKVQTFWCYVPLESVGSTLNECKILTLGRWSMRHSEMNRVGRTKSWRSGQRRGGRAHRRGRGWRRRRPRACRSWCRPCRLARPASRLRSWRPRRGGRRRRWLCRWRSRIGWRPGRQFAVKIFRGHKRSKGKCLGSFCFTEGEVRFK